MQVDLTGRVRNISLPHSQSLLPLFEAIINSIHSIEDASNSNGQINVKILRVPQGTFLQEAEFKTDSQVVGFEIVDNGTGFTEDNYRSFNTSDTQWKVNRGGKGVGRFLWLKCFRLVSIDSTYLEDGQWNRRTFDFALSASSGVLNLKKDDIPDGELHTSVVLTDLLEKYAEHIPQHADTIAHRIIEHCLEYFVLGRMPLVFLHDSSNEMSLDLNKMYRELVTNSDSSDVEIRGHKFSFKHFMVQGRAGLGHKLNFCGNHRVVKEDKLSSSKIANLPNRLQEVSNDNSVVYVGYISGEYLDKHINQQRTDFEFVNEPLLLSDTELTWDELQQTMLEHAKIFLQPYTDPVKEQKEERVAQYVQDQAPQYRFLLKNHLALLDKIPPSISDEKLEIALFEIQHSVEIQLKQRGYEILHKARNTNVVDQGFADFVQRFSTFLEDWNELGKADLAKYIVKRKAMLTFLEESINLQTNGKYLLENAIHGIIFPLRSTSDDIEFEQQNLWIIDEKLVYHRYLASDLPLKQVNAVTVDSLDRPDLIIFDRPFAAVNDQSSPYNAIVIFEFKRPMRDNYIDNDNPLNQVLNYVDKIRNDKELDKRGRPLRVTASTPFYCYILCDLTPSLESQARMAGMVQTPDKLGYFWYNQNYNAYVEMISYEKLLNDAKKRNQVLFDKLNMHSAI